ncbi:MAG: glutamate--tRNA ligase family protein, partial [Humidesulfovibrio sp.]|nr:glutamate--tRNA ligase family protein [Humidesulfovibrio sp.]
VRGQDILASTPRQIFLYRLLGAPIPQYAHLPLVLDSEGERLAKRHNSLTVAALREAGVSAPAITGYLAWRVGLQSAPRPCTPQSLIQGFDIRSIRRESVRLPADIAGVLASLK